jgi:uncharacterized NAD-dependent epimerase/dehydratase family protein
MLTADMPVVLLQHDGLSSLRGKTGLAMLRYRPGPIVAVIDPIHAGRSLTEVTGIPRDVPVVADMAAALAHRPAVAVVGLAPSGGRLPDRMRSDLATALRAGHSVASGLHSQLGEDPELASLLQPGRWIWDLRREPAGLSVAEARAATLPCRRWLAVGSDMSVGKMSVCLELAAAGRRRGLDTRFVGTGQAGILISGGGVPLDAVRVDYAAGAVERAVLDAAAAAGPEAVLLIEGQGSLCHAGSSATLPLIRGSQPTALVLVHRAAQDRIHNQPHIPLPSLPRLIGAVEALAELARPLAPGTAAPRVRAVALNTAGLGSEEAERAMAAVARETGLPVADAVRQGGESLLAAMLDETGEIPAANRPG